MWSLLSTMFIHNPIWNIPLGNLWGLGPVYIWRSKWQIRKFVELFLFYFIWFTNSMKGRAFWWSWNAIYMCEKDSTSTNPVIANEQNYRPTFASKVQWPFHFLFAYELTTIYIGYMFTTLATVEGENAYFIVLCRARVFVS